MENQEQQKAPELGVSDLLNVRTLLDVAIKRGTFAPNELSSVGAVYDKLNTFLNAVTPQGQDQKTQDSAE
jgi:hypothetical protein